MKKQLFLWLILILFCLSISAQKISKPTLTPQAPTASQKILIQQAIVLHDNKQYDAAIKKYEQVLAENPDCTLAMYEMAFSLYSKSDKNKAMEIALKGAQYKSDELTLFYNLIASAIDDQGRPQDAIKIYQDAIKILRDEKDFLPYLSSLHYNLGVTYTRQKQYKEARETLKKAVEYNHRYASSHYLLAEVFYGSKYKIPALLAAIRFISLEYNTPRTKRAASLVSEIIKSNASKGANGNTTVNLDFFAPEDEGNFSAIELILAVADEADDKKAGSGKASKSFEEKFVSKIETLISFLESDDKKTGSTFVGKNYFPFLVEMKKRDYAKSFAYLVLSQSGNLEAEKWLNSNNQKAIDFINWAKTY